MKKVIVLLLVIIIFSVGFIPFFLHKKIKYTIEIIGNKNITINANEEYKDEGAIVDNNIIRIYNFKTINNVDTSKPGTYEVIYKKKDVEAKRIVNVIDIEKPTIKLVKNNFYAKNSKTDLLDYVEVTDNCDKDLIKKIKIDSNINTKKDGTYKVKYIVKDSSNNESTLETSIVVQDKDTNGIPVLMYHWFYDDTKGETFGEKNSHNYIAKTEFEKQMKYLKDNNYYFLSWQELEDYIDGKIDLPKKSIVLTDDDCVNSFFDVALPVLQEYKIPMTSFCITNKTYYKDFLNEKYIDFESHTDSLHKRSCEGKWNGAVMCSDYETIYNDIKKSLEIVKNNNAFAYPFGHYNDDTIKALQNNGIKLAFTIEDGKVKKGANKYLLPRVRISRSTTIEKYINLIK
ncbi:MAG: DUF5011 domain-containing protein [Bacilli bacterium]|nr:DUF5011 domain-containing protein [Bacilli bacterium]